MTSDIDREGILAELTARFERDDPNNAIAWTMDQLAELGAFKYAPPADDPSKDLAGTLRKKGSRRPHVRRGGGYANPWLDLTTGEVLPDRAVIGWEIIGAVPGTPAAKAQELELWTGDGSEEPPSHVKKVRDRHGDIAQRNAKGRWSWIQISGSVYLPDSPGWQMNEEADSCAPFTEVRDQ